jgi:glucuronate isomerase
MTRDLQNRLYQELDSLILIDPHTHINPLRPASINLADMLGYHYYTELVHSAGLSQAAIEDPKLSAKEKVECLVTGLSNIDNTIQFHWLLEAVRELFGIEVDRIDSGNWEFIYDSAEAKMAQPYWEDQVLGLSNLQSVFLTNDFDDSLEGFDTGRYIPCLRTDDLVFHLNQSSVVNRLQACSGIGITQLSNLRLALSQRFEHFTSRGAKACAISLPPWFSPEPVSDAAAQQALSSVLANPNTTMQDDQKRLSYWVFWQLAENCSRYHLPFDLMIGVNRRVYPSGVFQGQDLYDSRVSLIQYAQLFNAFPTVTFPISVLASVTNQELASYSWIFPNVVCNGHWWYSNTPSFIRRDLQARMEAVPKNKLIGYYSDMYKLEFALPKFRMFKRSLASVLADHFILELGWSERRACELGVQLLRGNVEAIFGC